MTRSIVLEENEDGTMTMTVKEGEQEFSFLMPGRFEDVLGMVPPELLAELSERAERDLIHIPNDTSQA